MTTYKISGEGGEVERQATIRRSVYLGTTAALVGLLLNAQSIMSERNLLHVFYWTTFLGLLLALYVFYVIRKTKRILNEAYSSFTLNVDEASFTKIQKNTPTVTILRSEVRRIEELQGKGFRICTDSRSHSIWVPVELENYESLRSELLAQGLPFKTVSNAWLRSYAMYALFLCLFIAQAISHNKFVVACSASFISACLFYSFFAHYRNPNLTSRGKRQILWAAFVGVVLLCRAASVLGP